MLQLRRCCMFALAIAALEVALPLLVRAQRLDACLQNGGESMTAMRLLRLRLWLLLVVVMVVAIGMATAMLLAAAC